MISIDEMRINKEDRKPNTQYMYYRVEGNGLVNNGTSSQKERYSTKTAPVLEYWYDVSCCMDVSPKARPDNIIHRWFMQNKKIYSIAGHKDIFRYKDLPLEKFEECLVEFAEEQCNEKPNTPLKPRDYQKNGAKTLINFIKGSETKFLLEALPGYGKTFTLYFSILEAKAVKKIAIITSLTLVKQAFVKDFIEQNLAAKGCALKYKENGVETILGDWNTAEYKFIAAPKFVNSVFKEFINDPNCLWVHDEAHLGGASKKSEDFYKDKKVLFITATGNKLFDKVTSNYFFGISAMTQAIKHNPSLKTIFPIPQIEIAEKFQDIDFSNLKNVDEARLEALINDIVEKSTDDPNLIKNGLVKVGGRYSESAYKLYEIARTIHPEISWYLSADGNNSKSADNEGNKLKGPIAIQRFDHDCEIEPNKTHILITQYQGKESYSYYDLHNVFYLSESSSPESFIQTFGRLERPKKNSGTEYAKFYMYSSFVHFIELMCDEYKRDCTRNNKSFDMNEFEDFVRLYSITADVTILPEKMTAEYILNLLSTRSTLIRGCPNQDLILLSKYFREVKEKGSSGLFDNFKKIDKPNKSTTYFVSSDDSTTPEATKKEKAKFTLQDKEKVELIFGRVSFYCRFLDYYKQHPDKVQKKKEFLEKVKGYKYPETVADLRALPTYNARSLIYNFRDNSVFSKLFNNLSDTFMENLLLKITKDRNKDLEELTYGSYSPYSKTKVDDGKIKDKVFKTNFLPKITTNKNGKICLVRTGVNTVLLLKQQGFSDITYYTDIVAEKFKCDYYGINYKYVKCVNQKEDWVETFKSMAVDFDLIIMNPPYDLGNKITKAILPHLNDTGKLVNLMPLSYYKANNLYAYISDFELVDPKVFEDATITNNLNISILVKDKVNVYTWDSLLLKSFKPEYMEFYKWNVANNKGLSMKQNNYKPYTSFNIDTDFIETSLCYSNQGGAGFGLNGCGYKFNVNKKDYEKDWLGHIGHIIFASKKAKDNFCKYWYNGKKWESLASRMITGVNATEASSILYMSIPQIDWEAIETNSLWQAGQYDDAVLDVMGLKWDTNKETIITK